jgi:hypothetical protein
MTLPSGAPRSAPEEEVKVDHEGKEEREVVEAGGLDDANESSRRGESDGDMIAR